MTTADSRNIVPAPPGPDTPNFAAIDERLRVRLAGRAWADVPVIDPTVNPYRERLQRYAQSMSLSRIVIARPQRQWYTYADLYQVSENVVVNPGPGTANYGMNWSQSTSHTHSVEISASVSAGFFDIVEVSLTTTYGHSWTTETARGENVSVDILPRYMGWIDRATLINNLDGDFIWTGNTPSAIGTIVGVEVGVSLPGQDGQPFRWRATSSGSAKRGAHSGVLVTSQAPLSSTGNRALDELGERIERGGDRAAATMSGPDLIDHDRVIRTVLD